MGTWRHDMGHEETLDVWWLGIHPFLCFIFYVFLSRAEKVKCEEEEWMEEIHSGCLFAADLVGLLSMKKKKEI